MFTLSKLKLKLINLEFSMDMKKFILLTAVLTLLASCGSKDRGELVGVTRKKMAPRKTLWNGTNSWRCVYYG